MNSLYWPKFKLKKLLEIQILIIMIRDMNIENDTTVSVDSCMDSCELGSIVELMSGKEGLSEKLDVKKKNFEL